MSHSYIISSMKNMTLHGANPESLCRALSLKVPERITDFSTNTNVLTWPGYTLDVAGLSSRYPDPECTALREIISLREGVPMSRILFTNGVNQAIFLLSEIFADGTAIFQPCYTEYSRAFTESQDIFTLSDAGKFQHVAICNPVNPTGRFIPDLSRVIAGNPQTVFTVDEAYVDFLRGHVPERLCDFPNAVILRSLTKVFPLSGARIGYVITDEKIIEAMKSRLPSWSVNAFAQELALRFLADVEFLRRTREFYRQNTPAFMAGFREAGFDVVDSDTHYFLVRVDDDVETVRRLLTRGMAVRHTRNFTGFCGGYVRVATRFPEENMRLIAAMKEELS